MSALSAVCFDLDGTLCVNDQDGAALLSRAFADAGIDPWFDRETLRAVDPGTLPAAQTDREFYEHYFRAGARHAGVAPDPGDVDALAGAYLDRYDPTAVRLRDGAAEVLAAARDRCPVGLVTNGGEATQTAKLAELDLADAFDVTVFCDPAGGVHPKPDTAGLSRAIADLAAPAGETLMIGDTLGTDVAGAHALDMQSAWVPRHAPDPEPSPEPTHVFESMPGVAGLF